MSQAAAAFRSGLPVVSCKWLMASALAARLLDVQPFVYLPPTALPDCARHSDAEAHCTSPSSFRDTEAAAASSDGIHQSAAMSDTRRNYSCQSAATPDMRVHSVASDTAAFAPQNCEGMMHCHVGTRAAVVLPDQPSTAAFCGDALSDGAIPDSSQLITQLTAVSSARGGHGSTPFRDITNTPRPLRSSAGRYVTVRRQRRRRPPTSSPEVHIAPPLKDDPVRTATAALSAIKLLNLTDGKESGELCLSIYHLRTISSRDKDICAFMLAKTG